jgi:hypothetical protein
MRERYRYAASGGIGNLSLASLVVRCSSTMAHFPTPHGKTRSPRISVPSDGAVKFNLGRGLVSATLRSLSTNGGLAEFSGNIGTVPLAEMALETPSGPVKGLVEFLNPPQKEKPSCRPFRFIAIDEEDYRRLRATVQKLSAKGR